MNCVDIRHESVDHGDETFDVEVRNGHYCCPLDDCGRRFDSAWGLKMHFSVKHSLYAVHKRTCENCGDEFTQSRARTRFCSAECVTEGGSSDMSRCDRCASFVSGSDYTCKNCGYVGTPQPSDGQWTLDILEALV